MKKKFGGFSQLALILGLVLPQLTALKKDDFRGVAQALTIQLPTATPVYAAFYDSLDISFTMREQSMENLQELEISESFLPVFRGKKIETIIASSKSTRSSISQKQWQPLKGIEVSAALPIKQQRPKVLSAEEYGKINNSPASTVNNALPFNLAETIGQNKKPKVNEMDYVTRVNYLVGEQLKSASKNPSTKFSGVYISRTKKNKEEIQSHGQAGTEKANDEESVGLFGNQEQVEYYEPRSVSGVIRLKDGILFTGRNLVISQYYGNQRMASGYIKVEDEVSFNISLNGALGYVVGEIFNDEGELLGYGELKIKDLPALGSNEDQVRDVELVLNSIKAGIRGQVISAYSYKDDIQLVDGLQLLSYDGAEPIVVKSDGGFEILNVERNSSLVVQAKAPHHWGALSLVHEGVKQQIQMFHKNYLKSFLDQVTKGELSLEDISEFGIIWGQVSKEGKPQSNIKVEIAGEYMKPIYFSGFLPDLERDSTSDNGFFVFINVPKGMKLVRTYEEVGDRVTYNPATILPVAAEHVSYVDIEVNNQEQITGEIVKFTNELQPLSGDLQVVGSGQSIGFNKNLFEIEVEATNKGHYVEIDAGEEYELSQVWMPKNSRHTIIPVMEKAWVNQMAAKIGVPIESDKGIAIGFMDNTRYEIEVVNDDLNQEMQIVFFNHRGEFHSTTEPAIDGGFILFNLEKGYNQISVNLENATDSKYLKALMISPEVLSIF